MITASTSDMYDAIKVKELGVELWFSTLGQRHRKAPEGRKVRDERDSVSVTEGETERTYAYCSGRKCRPEQREESRLDCVGSATGKRRVVKWIYRKRKIQHRQVPSQAEDSKTLARRVMNIMPNREQGSV